MDDDIFSDVTWNKAEPWNGILNLANGRTVRISLDIDEAEEESAGKTLKTLIANETEIRRKVAVSLFEQYHDWVCDDVASPEALALRIDLADIFLWEGGGGQLYYEANGDDYLFTDHTVCVWFDADGEIEHEVSLEG